MTLFQSYQAPPVGDAKAFSYRPDIDGLRAVAVLLVLAFHLGFRPVPGGFIGVDVFFVVSGYLIGGMVFKEVANGTFSFVHFFERRIRRLFPALFAMLATTTVAAWIVLYPTAFFEFGRTLAAAITSTSNFYFWLTLDYFDTASTTNPLLHTWSLAVEEQFYILFPLLALASHRWAKEHVTLIVAAVGVVSFVWSALTVQSQPEAAFYLLHSRAWELALGIVLARAKLPPLSAWIASVLCAAGLALILASAILLTDETPFPGFAAAPACVGTALVIIAGSSRNFFSMMLSLRPVVFVGLISYSLYLWHWPLIVLYQYRLGLTYLAVDQKILLLAISLVVAVLSWRFIEQPFRRGPRPTPIFGKAGGVAAALMACAIAIVLMQGVPTRFAPEVVRMASYLNYADTTDEVHQHCFIEASSGGFEDFDMANCLTADASRPDILLVGDSHAADLREGLEVSIPQANVMQATASECKPVVVHQWRDAPGCVRLINHVYDDYLETHDVDLFVLSARWVEEDIPNVAATLDRLNALGVPVVLVGPIAQYHSAVPQLLALSIMNDDPGLPARRLRGEIADLDVAMRALAEEKGVRYASTYAALCPEGQCHQLSAAGVPLQHDYAHLTREGSLYVVARLVESGGFELASDPALH